MAGPGRHMCVYPPPSLKTQQEDTGLHRQRGEQEKLKRRKSENMGGSAIAGFEPQMLRPTPAHPPQTHYR